MFVCFGMCWVWAWVPRGRLAITNIRFSGNRWDGVSWALCFCSVVPWQLFKVALSQAFV